MSWGEIYNTSWWGVALDTARTVKARPDFFGSQLNLLTSEQPNLITNGDFATDSDWSLGVGWSISNGKLRGDNASGYAIQSSVFAAGVSNIYKINLTVSDYVSGYFTILTGGGTSQSQQFNANGNYTIYLNTNNPSNTNFHFTYFGAFTGSIDNVSVQLVRADLDQIEAKKCLADWIHTTALKDLNN